MTRFLFGVLIGVLLTIYVQTKGEDILRVVGIDPNTFSVERLYKKVTRSLFGEESSENPQQSKISLNPQHPSANK